jgi:hypothetical protein
MTPTLYILMRTDLDSLNLGKAIAQGSHATNMFEQDINDLIQTKTVKNKTIDAYYQWREDRDFGRCLVVGADIDKIKEIQSLNNNLLNNKYLNGIVFDPTYPITDGKVIHTLSVETCSYIFIHDNTSKFLEYTDVSINASIDISINRYKDVLFNTIEELELYK